MMTKNEILVVIHAFGQVVGALDRWEFRAYLTEHLGVPEDEIDSVLLSLRKLSRVWLPAADDAASKAN